MSDDAWVILEYHAHEPVRVYGLFESEEEARWYAEREKFETFNVQMLVDAWKSK